MLYLRFVRSPYAHAKIVSVDTAEADKIPGVICTLTGAEIASQTQPFIEIAPDAGGKIRDFPMAVSKVRYQGEPVVAVVAVSPGIADDGAEAVQVEYDALDPVVDAQQALTDASILHEEPARTRSGTACSNTATWTRRFGKLLRWSQSTACTSTDFRAPRWKIMLSSDSGIRKTNASTTGAITRFHHLRSSFWRRTSACTSIAFVCRHSILAAASGSRSRAIRRCPYARSLRKKQVAGRSNGSRRGQNT